VKRALAVLALAATGCTHRWQPEADCVAGNVPLALRSLPEIRSLAHQAPMTLEAGFVLCSTHRDRLDSAIEALGKEGYSSYLGAARFGKCLRIARTHEASPEAMEREITAICRIAAANRIAYRHWQAEVGGNSVVLANGRFKVNGMARQRDR
jgi:hypothetical protein